MRLADAGLVLPGLADESRRAEDDVAVDAR